MVKLLRILALSLLALMIAVPAFAAKPPFNGSPEFEMMLWSGGDWEGEPFAADENPWHAFFEEPQITATTPGFSYSDIQDISQLANFDMLYIIQEDVDAFGPGDMATVKSWVTAGGSLVIGDTDEGDSAMGSFLGASYAFTGVEDPDGDAIVNVDPTHPLNTTPNVLGPVELSNWGSSVHGALTSLGSAYTCISDSTDGDATLPVMCAASLGVGTVVIMGFDPECGCHDDHLDGEGGTTSGSEQLENLVAFAMSGVGSANTIPVPTLSNWALVITTMLIGLLGFGAMRRYS